MLYAPTPGELLFMAPILGFLLFPIMASVLPLIAIDVEYSCGPGFLKMSFGTKLVHLAALPIVDLVILRLVVDYSRETSIASAML